jgi:hypothetical protein
VEAVQAWRQWQAAQWQAAQWQRAHRQGLAAAGQHAQGTPPAATKRRAAESTNTVPNPVPNPARNAAAAAALSAAWAVQRELDHPWGPMGTALQAAAGSTASLRWLSMEHNALQAAAGWRLVAHAARPDDALTTADALATSGWAAVRLQRLEPAAQGWRFEMQALWPTPTPAVAMAPTATPSPGAAVGRLSASASPTSPVAR